MGFFNFLLFPGADPFYHSDKEANEMEKRQNLSEMTRRDFLYLGGAGMTALSLAGLSGIGHAQEKKLQEGESMKIEKGYAKNFDLVGYHDLEGKPALKIAMQVVNNRWYLYLGHFWIKGWSIVDVTNPAKPEYIKFIPGPDNTSTAQVQVADGIMITALSKGSEGFGTNPEGPFEEGIYIWDVKDPVNPKRLAHYKTGATGTHRNHWEGGRYVHLTATARGYSGHICTILDIVDPSKPVEVGRWWLPDQWTAGGAKLTKAGIGLHGPAYPEGNRAYLGYGAAGMIILDISDITLPKLVSRLEFHPPLGSRLACHTVLPLLKRKLALVCSEALEENCRESLNYAGIVDIADEKNPRLISLFPLPEPPPGAPYKNFCEKGGRFGPHNFHIPQRDPYREDRDDRVYLTYFNAGLRLYDIRDPYLPKEVACYLPPDPKKRLGVLPKTLVVQSEDVLVDRRGYSYVTDKNHGLHILRCTV